jgi:uncharacterized SAM-dependent methyltransferase
MIVKDYIKNQEPRKIWSLEELSLWYLTEEQAKEYLRITEEGSYSQKYVSAEKDLIKNSKSEIVRKLSDSFNIVDLGCGDGSKALELILESAEQGKNTIYVPVDINQYMLDLAEEKAKGLVRTVPINADLTKLSLPEITRDLHPNNLLLFAGHTFGNFDTKYIANHLSANMQSNDYLLIGMQTRNMSIDAIITAYNSKPVEDWVFLTPKQAGFTKEDLSYKIMYDTETKRITFVFTVLNVPIDLQDTRMSRGDEIRVLFSYKPTTVELRMDLEQHFDIKMYTNQQNSCALSLCKLKS